MLTDRQVTKINEVMDNIDGVDAYSILHGETEGESRNAIREFIKEAIRIKEKYGAEHVTSRGIVVDFCTNDNLIVALTVGYWSTEWLDNEK